MGARGSSLVEVLLATFVLSVGLVALASGLGYAARAIEIGRGETIAFALAEERLELLRAAAVTDWSAPILAAGTTREDYGTIASVPTFRRDTTIVDRTTPPCAGVASESKGCKAMRVTVAYRLGLGGERTVDLWTIVTPRP